MRRDEILRNLQNLIAEYNRLSSMLEEDDPPPPNVDLRPSSSRTIRDMNEHVRSIEALKEENARSQKEVSFLKYQLKRCNEMLNRYVAGADPAAVIDCAQSIEEEGPQMSRASVYKLHGLILAYDDVVNEQESTINRMKASFEGSLKRMNVLVEENKRFHQFFATFGEGSCDQAELLRCAEDAKLMMENRKLLQEEINILHSKELTLKQDHEKKVESLRLKLQEEREAQVRLQEKLKKNEQKIAQLQECNEKLNLELKNCMAEEEHEKSLKKCSKYLDKLKAAHMEESAQMKQKARHIQEEKRNLEEMLHKAKSRFQGMRKEEGDYKIYLSKNLSQLRSQQNQIRSLATAKKALQAKLRNISQVSLKLVEDRKRLLQDVKDLQEELRKRYTEATNRSEQLGKLSKKMKEERLEMSQRLAELEGKRKGAEEAWIRSAKEVARLKKQLQSKDIALQTILDDQRSRLV